MFSVPGFDPTSMTDDELLNKQSELNRRYVYASRFSASTEMAAQFMAMIAAIENERRERVQRIAFDMRQGMFPDIIESEPDLIVRDVRPSQEEEANDRMAERRRASRNRMITRVNADEKPTIPKKTAAPTKTDEKGK